MKAQVKIRDMLIYYDGLAVFWAEDEVVGFEKVVEEIFV